jgi:hypothetical protein
MDDTDKPALRRTLRGHLADRPSVALDPATLHSRYQREFGCTLQEVADALTFLEALGLLKIVTDPMGGSTKYYQATAAGIIAHESGL